MHNQGKGPFYLDLTAGTPEEIDYIEWSISHEGKEWNFLDYLKSQEGFDSKSDKLESSSNSREMAGTASSGLVVNRDLETGMKKKVCLPQETRWVDCRGSVLPGAFAMGWHAGGDGRQRGYGHQKAFFAVKGDTLERFN